MEMFLEKSEATLKI